MNKAYLAIVIVFFVFFLRMVLCLSCFSDSNKRLVVV